MSRTSLLPLLIALLWLPGCAAMTAVAVVPGALYEVATSELVSEERSYPAPLDRTLAGVQSSLRSMQLDVDVLEIQNQGYAIAFGNDRLNGYIGLKKMTPMLTTMQIKVRSTMREASVEQAIIDAVRISLKQKKAQKKFRYAGYERLRESPASDTAQLGWYRRDARLDTMHNGKSAWLRLKLPSGKTAFIKDEAAQASNTRVKNHS